MNAIITFKRLVELIAKTSGCPAAEADAFVRAFTSLVRDVLSTGENLKIKGIGEFCTSEDGRVTLIPDPELAAAINEPFSMFVAEELDENTTLEDLNAEVENPSQGRGASCSPQQEEASFSEPRETDSFAEQSESDNPKEEEMSIPVSEPVQPVVPDYAPWPEEEEEAVEEENQHEEAKEPVSQPYRSLDTVNQSEMAVTTNSGDGFSWFWMLIGLLAGLILGIAIGFFIHDPIEEWLEPSLAENSVYDAEEGIVEEEFGELALAAPEQQEPVEEVPPAAVETPVVEPAPAPAAAQEVKEKVVFGTSLAKLSKKHYGSNVYWVYIYLENKDIIPSPDNLKEGIVLVIPPLEKYATQATETERKNAAQKKANEILNQQKKR